MEYPFSWNNMILYYNTAIFEEEGGSRRMEDWTWDDFLAVCEKVSRVSGAADDRYAYSFWGRQPVRHACVVLQTTTPHC